MNPSPSTSIERARDRKPIWVFTPSRTDPKDLEFILVQRHKLLEDAVERVRESALTDHKHHLLFIGPRGCGKTHLITLVVNRLSEQTDLADRLRIAWLNEDETCTTLLELLCKIHAALEKRYPAEFRAEMLSPAYDLPADAAREFVAKHLLAALGSRTLLVVTENLDALFEGIGDAGQKQLRSFIQENPRLTILATAQRLVEDLATRTSPFFGFFQTEHLRPLNVPQATELLQNLARLRENGEIVEFLGTTRGRARVRAIHHLSGGNHRIYIVLSQFITRDTVEALLEPFMKMVDELTPYYQERIRWLPPLQRKIVEFLCSCESTVPVKEIARRLFATPQTISSQLQDLREKGYVEAHQRGRESLYEISEPLMRICVEVKDNQRHQPLRLLVDFLRVWYDDQELKHRLGQLGPACASGAYLQSALERNREEGNLRRRILLDELPATIRKGKFGELQDAPDGLLLALHSVSEGNPADSIRCLDEAITEAATPVNKGALLLYRAELHFSSGDRTKEIADYSTVIDLPYAPAEQVAKALVNRGIGHQQAEDFVRAKADYTAAIELPGAPVEQVAKALVNRGITHGEEGDLQHEIADYTAVVELSDPPVEQVAIAIANRGVAYGQAGDLFHAIADCTTVIDLPGAPVAHVAYARFNRGFAHSQAGDSMHAIADYAGVIGMQGAPIEHVTRALVNRGFALNLLGESMRAIADFTAVIGLPGAPVEQVAKALLNRGAAQGMAGDPQREIADYTAVIGLPGAPIKLVAIARYLRGVNHLEGSRKQLAEADLRALISLPEVRLEMLADAQLSLAEILCSEGQWSEGFQGLAASLRCAAKVPTANLRSATGLIGVVFSAGLNPEGRREKVTKLLRIYAGHNSLAVLGEAVIQHVGTVYRSGAPFPSTDNLEGWASAWEQAAGSEPDFRLSVRLLRTGIDFVKSGGKDRGILLTLTSPERAILQQALGLAARGEAETS